MDIRATISERLLSEAADSVPAQARELEKAARKIASYSRAPGNRKQADRIAPVLTAAAVTALGEAFLALREEEINDPHPVFGNEFRQADYAFAALLIAAGDPELEPTSRPSIERVIALIPDMDTQQAEHVHYLSGQYSGLEAAGSLHTAAASHLGHHPETEADVWARQLSLDLPKEYWQISVAIPSVLTTGPLDANVFADITNFTGDRTDWNIRIGAINRDMLGGSHAPAVSRGVELGHYSRESRREGGPAIDGAIAPAQSFFDLPRVLADLEAAHPELSFDREALTARGGPGRLATPSRKKLLKAWLTAE